MANHLNKVMSLFVINNVVNQNFIGKLVTASMLHQPRYMSIKAQKIELKEFGDPSKVLNLVECTYEEPVKDQVTLKFLLAPVNPADINTVQGVYPIKPSLPGVPGSEGIAEVIAVGPEAKNIKLGDRVIPNKQPFGTWRTHSVVSESDVFKVPKDLGLAEVAAVTSNPGTAYRMLKDFATLRPGDIVLQNGGNSAVGQNVIQLARAWGLTSVSVVRDRPDIADLRSYLLELGADHVLTEEELEKQRDFFPKNNMKKPKLAMNCVGGKNALTLLRNLDNNGVMVTYGGMSREPVSVPTSAFIFKNISLHGFWMTNWHKEHRNSEEQRIMFEDLFQLMRDGKLKAPRYKVLPLSQYKDAISNTMNIKGFAGFKYFLDLTS
ncbi:enoyl-[acyl-carrier-protein] reductase, mitochondrial-like isoform X1 [Macrosteles quadrilineatus]|uniref:enoyl-[acyl-carrier-protein] reductase, mitochondrial-like isoform X1 n=1 Tax=Macrosteles quadrilineatus TaxID=74068 RepID=UPI0023E09FB8|nr:enoyl-[acyl-carrier-protein] reductase, mitochondrial-like isoform X1 [Macrosteles quadrilineatus]